MNNILSLKLLAFITVMLTGALLLYGVEDMPAWGDPNSPANTHVSPRYIESALEDTATPNIVTAVLADYRGYDTLGETTVIFTAGIACLYILRRPRKLRKGRA
jgi:multicomponent Na+:H+ antiporter subunit B